MAIEFPNSPVEGDQFTASNGVIYTYENGGWNGNSASGLEDVFVNISGDEMSGNLTVPSLNGGQLAGFRNQIINGDFRIWQRGTTFTTTTQSYTADRWTCVGASISRQQAGTQSTIRINSSTQTYAYQPIELYQIGGSVVDDRFTVGSTWTLSYFCDHAPDPTLSRILQFSTGTSSAATNIVDAVTGGIPLPTKTGLVKNVKEQYSTTFTIQNAPSTANNCLLVYIASSSTGTDVDFCDVQLEPGPVATPFEHRPIATELALCQRYYIELGGNTPQIYMILNGTNYFRQFQIELPTTMRVAPSTTSTQNTQNYTIESNTNTLYGAQGSMTATEGEPILNISADAEL